MSRLSVLKVENLVAGYEQRVLLRNLFLAVSAPFFVAVVGHNGGGKTTLLRVLTGPLPYEGDIELAGRRRLARFFALPTDELPLVRVTLLNPGRTGSTIHFT